MMFAPLVLAVPLMRDALQWVHDVAKAINTSKRRADFLEIVSDLKGIPRTIPKTLSYSVVCPNWCNVFYSGYFTYPAVLEMMDNLVHARVDISSAAAGLFHQLQKCEVYLSLLIARNVFGSAEKTTSKHCGRK